jgi:hypothetical protein
MLKQLRIRPCNSLVIGIPPEVLLYVPFERFHILIAIASLTCPIKTELASDWSGRSPGDMFEAMSRSCRSSSSTQGFSLINASLKNGSSVPEYFLIKLCKVQHAMTNSRWYRSLYPGILYKIGNRYFNTAKERSTTVRKDECL